MVKFVQSYILKIPWGGKSARAGFETKVFNWASEADGSFKIISILCFIVEILLAFILRKPIIYPFAITVSPSLMPKHSKLEEGHDIGYK